MTHTRLGLAAAVGGLQVTDGVGGYASAAEVNVAYASEGSAR